ncbi:MAG: hypothetical protein HS114_11995 [Anaerolineales bacterium]|nr:hypothetical protein [Anaerolineales bacterium]
MIDQNNPVWRNPRQIIERITIKGDLVLQTAAHFGGGDSPPWSRIDMALLRDPLEGRALLPGASIAGALRNYLRERLGGYDSPVEAEPLTRLLGGSKGDDDGAQSLLLIDDALAEMPQIELRDGVKIEAASRTADKGQLFNMELLPAGTRFELVFELLVPAGQRDELARLLALALQGFEAGPSTHAEITLGARKRRGLGRGLVKKWRVECYKLTEKQGLIGWLDESEPSARSEGPIATALGLAAAPTEDARSFFELKAKFALDSSLLIRSHYDELGLGADFAHLHVTGTDGQLKPIVPGTSWAGVVRHRALRIAKTLRPSEGETLVNRMFGAAEDKPKNQALTASRVVVDDSTIEAARPWVQTRIQIDRFTGGAYPGALFEEAPIFGDKTAYVTLHLTLRNPADHEVGLLLLVLKDLWSGDLPVGGESSVGRGRLAGQEATLTFKGNGAGVVKQTIKLVNDKLVVEKPAALQEYVDKLHTAAWEEINGTQN